MLVTTEVQEYLEYTKSPFIQQGPYHRTLCCKSTACARISLQIDGCIHHLRAMTWLVQKHLDFVYDFALAQDDAGAFRALNNTL